MAAHYDTYDYPAYWIGREYEHKSETLALKSFLTKIPKIKTIIDIGSGFGRLTPTYLHRARQITLVDPSSKLLGISKEELKSNKKVTYIRSSVENIANKIKSKKYDLALLIRVAHHLPNIDSAFINITSLIKVGGYLILEFPNKKHFKATFCEFFQGNLTFPFDIFPKDIRTKKHKGKKTLPFINYHPDDILELLKGNNFEIIEKRSVSNIRSSLLKKLLPIDSLLFLENALQRPLSYINFGPSIFILARKRG